MGIIGSYVMRTLPLCGGNINGKQSEEEAIVPVPKWCGFDTISSGPPPRLESVDYQSKN